MAPSYIHYISYIAYSYAFLALLQCSNCSMIFFFSFTLSFTNTTSVYHRSNTFSIFPLCSSISLSICIHLTCNSNLLLFLANKHLQHLLPPPLLLYL
ncbi:hypothetical protein FGO68_gene10965 [Halteria grandinella]|uniref:Uncharacterized protein n=1 Tax=Halteria grandinella TaxID=5974 RepID=A0A8J8T491_HALGN|nr:hypothetical protein FGO68_gene10965 [Halteria grandinella]